MTREELINSCEGIIHTQAKKFCRRYKLNDAISDLEQEGRLAVLKLIKKNTYDPKKSPFHIYAQPFIHGAM
jgi:DNA-directed RNA polymerase specialized sigma subunit